MTTRQEIHAVPTVPFTKTWRPVHHKDVLSAVDSHLYRNNIEVLKESFQLSTDGKDLFGTISITNPYLKEQDTKRRMQIGLRNSMKKRFSLGFVAGDQVMVCSNMCFFGEFEEHHRHDSTLTQLAVEQFTASAIETVIDKQGQYRAWFDDMSYVQLNDNDLKVLSFNAMKDGIINPSNFHAFLNDWDDEVKTQRDYVGEYTLAHFHGAVTRNLRSVSINQQMARTRKLEPMLNEWWAKGKVDNLSEYIV